MSLAYGSIPTRGDAKRRDSFEKGCSPDMLAVVQVLLLVLNIAWWIIIASAILSWLLAFNILDARNQFVRTITDFLYRMTEPLFRPIRRILPTFGGLDLSPLVVLLIIFFIQQIIFIYVVPAIYRAGI
ncbi:YggT family protein [Aureimonas sp. AU12]|uniref:YggT family protein n=1 Tax=Aureimonas sp. AU12 TaxID=1638161 RepID=UPI000ACD4CF2|nr:YggT family protein [Aureimonas sp. AU12]